MKCDMLMWQRGDLGEIWVHIFGAIISKQEQMSDGSVLVCGCGWSYVGVVKQDIKETNGSVA